jgi:hypothetical protein
MPYNLAVTPGPGFYTPPDVQRARMADQQRNTDAAIQRRRDLLQAGIQQNRDAQLASYQAERDRQLAQYEQDRGTQSAYNQSILSQQAAEHQRQRDLLQHQQGMEQQAQGADLQAQLNAVKLGQEDTMRMHRLYQSRDAINANPNLSAEEKDNLLTQVVTNLNPLENRQRQQQMLFQQIQSQALQQQTQQQATLFNQHQAWLAQGAQAATTTITDPNTGYTGLFFRNAHGELTPLEFPMQQQRMDMAHEAHQLSQQQGWNQLSHQIALQPGQIQLQQHQIRHAGLTNEALGQDIAHLNEMHPLQQQSLRQEIQWRMQQMQQSADLHDPAVAMAYRQLVLMNAHINSAIGTETRATELHPGNLAAQGLHNDLVAGQIRAQPGLLEHQDLTNQLLRGQVAEQQRAAVVNAQPLAQRIETVVPQATRTRVEANIDTWIRDNLGGHIAPEVRQQWINEQLEREGGMMFLNTAHGPMPLPGGNGNLTQEQRAAHVQRAIDHVNTQMQHEEGNLLPGATPAWHTPLIAPAGQPAPTPAQQQAHYQRSREQERMRRIREQVRLIPGFEEWEPNIERAPAPAGAGGGNAGVMNELIQPNAQPAQMPPNPAAAGGLDAVRARLAAAASAHPANNRAWWQWGDPRPADVTAIEEMRDILGRATSANRDLTPAERMRYLALHQHQIDYHQAGRPDPAGFALPGAPTPYRGTPAQLRAMLELVRTHQDPAWQNGADHLTRVSLDNLLSTAVSRNRGLAPHEVERLNQLRARLAQNRQQYGRLHDQLALPE